MRLQHLSISSRRSFSVWPCPHQLAAALTPATHCLRQWCSGLQLQWAAATHPDSLLALSTALQPGRQLTAAYAGMCGTLLLQPHTSTGQSPYILQQDAATEHRTGWWSSWRGSGSQAQMMPRHLPAATRSAAGAEAANLCPRSRGAVPSEAVVLPRILRASSKQMRQHSSAAADRGPCWRCHAHLPDGAAFFCTDCGVIQPANASLSFYTVMGL